jgi:hypothetical protein
MEQISSFAIWTDWEFWIGRTNGGGDNGCVMIPFAKEDIVLRATDDTFLFLC